eukprot:TRINITY_DN32860_c0_g1_i1.p1 TRINITY_DN32860_c0_g1~~TRINITY_DN32860_c0_g1_i1.p1  ORF type:complete len:1159 (+),score=175.77 TRINITY_DN32860_c0_g1_i1:30-3479(+)
MVARHSHTCNTLNRRQSRENGGPAAITIVLAVAASCRPMLTMGELIDERHLPRSMDELGMELPERFFEDIYERSWVHLPAPRDGRGLGGAWSLRRVFAHAEAEGFEPYDEDGNLRSEDVDSWGASEARDVLRRGWSLIQRKVHLRCADLAARLRAITAYFGVPTGGATSYAAGAIDRDGALSSVVTSAYVYGAADAFLFQASGERAWEVCDRRLTDPLALRSTSFAEMPLGDVKNCIRVDLQAGDALYLPNGQVHRPLEVAASVSVHLIVPLNRLFLSASAMLLNVARQVNPSRETGFAQTAFVEWVHRVGADERGSFEHFHNVPRSLTCIAKKSRRRKADCPSKNRFMIASVSGSYDESLPLSAQEPRWPKLADSILRSYAEEVRELIEELRRHPSAKRGRLQMQVFVAGTEGPVSGVLTPTQVLDGLLPLISTESCRRALESWRTFAKDSLRQKEEQLEEAYLDGSFDMDITEIPRLGSDLQFEGTETFEVGSDGEVLRQDSIYAETADDLEAVQWLPSEEEEEDDRRSEGIRGVAWSYHEMRRPPIQVYKGAADSTRPSAADLQSQTEDVRSVGEDVFTDEGNIAADSGDAAATSWSVVWGDPEDEEDDTESGATVSEKPSATYQAEDVSVSTGASGNGCCNSHEGSLLACAVGLAKTDLPPPFASTVIGMNGPPMPPPSARRVVIVTSVSPEISGFGRYSAAVNAAWAARFGHSLSVDVGARPGEGRDFRSGIVWATRTAVREAPSDVGWVLRLDGDAVLANFDRDFLAGVIDDHPWAEVLLSRAVAQRAGSWAPSLFNFGVVLFRRSEYTLRLLDSLWEKLKDGGIDQEVFSNMYRANFSGLAAVTAVLPETALNSGRVAVASQPHAQPIYHLWSHDDDVREVVFREAWQQQCGGQLLLDLMGVYSRALGSVKRGDDNDSVSVQTSGNRDSARSVLIKRRIRLADVLIARGEIAPGEHALRSALDAYAEAKESSSELAQAAFGAQIKLLQLLNGQGSDRLSEADVVARRALRSCELHAAENIAECAPAQLALADTLFRLGGRNLEAEVVARKAWTGSSHAHGLMKADTQTNVATMLFNIALRGQGSTLEDPKRRARVDEAIALQRSALRIGAEQMQASDDWVKENQHNLRLMLTELGKRGEHTQ